MAEIILYNVTDINFVKLNKKYMALKEAIDKSYQILTNMQVFMFNEEKKIIDLEEQLQLVEYEIYKRMYPAAEEKE